MIDDKKKRTKEALMDGEINREIGDRIKTIRKALGLTQRIFADSIGFANTYVSKIEGGDGSPGPLFFWQISTVYNVSLEYLFHGTGDMFKLTTVTGENDTGVFKRDIDRIEDLAWLFNNSHIYRTAVVAFTTKFIYDNEVLIKQHLLRGNE
jgi:transcriptional regulator with XRE-family HTH domain